MWGRLIRRLRRLLGETEEIAELLARAARRRVRDLKREIRVLEKMKDDLARVEASPVVRKRLRKKYDDLIAKKLLELADASKAVR